MNKFIFPPFLKFGDLVTVIATSGALKELDAFEKGLEVWRSHGYQIKLGSNWNTRYGYLAGTDTQRRQALLEAWEDPNCKAILCARGGYGSARLLENWSWSKQSPKWIIGFSDVTGILWSLATENISSLHGPVLTTLANEPSWSMKRLFNYLEGHEVESIQGTGWGGGKALGWLLPANLTVATHILNTLLHPNLEGAILALEDVTEAPYRIDRMLTQWRLMGIFDKIKGIALGRFSRCEAPVESESWTVEEVLSDRLQNLNIPIVSDLPFGHDGVNAALPIGVTVELDSDRGTLKILT
ncbi:LD-carboxypeptidase [Aphanothece hegewaldii CCALA 016]|uniref:LD-carboxypeptidase n=1 Tax=Aphanothece hegewaldii CCALA 016 TaxID=2107694 RepID=A0A2T1M0X9_9CHRO|nr:LD-carboxypeptidase [Aphanothece hegewaldii]PSF38245.1 LD-carboxypeptidase [Aphanothece hegewaldii CCALA 016]